MNSMIQSKIAEYISDIDFKSGKWSINEIKANLKRMLGETPAIKVNYEKDVLINEIKGEAKEIKKISSLDIVFTDVDNNIKKMNLNIN